MTSIYFSNYLTYEPSTGKLYWKTPGRGRTVGKEAGTINGRGYKQFKLDGVLYLAHRVVFCMNERIWPSDEYVIDHKNGDGLDNRIENLRMVTVRDNTLNNPKKRNGLSVSGTFKERNKWRAAISCRIQWKQYRVYLGTFSTIEEAGEVYDKAKKEIEETSFRDFYFKMKGVRIPE
jgi:hypothetical protein